MLFKRIFLFPFAFLYGCITGIRNFLFNKGIKKSYVIPGKSIVIGNLSMGGTGKSPHTLYLWNLLHKTNDVSILSRGYGRKTKGLIEVKENHASEEVGDEPLMFKKRVGDTAQVVVSENRENGVKYIHSSNQKKVVLLDDAFQHRKVTAGLSILLTDYSHPFYQDCVVPAGTLREWKCGKNRANCVIVTKCPETISKEEKDRIKRKIVSPLIQKKRIFFSEIIYGDLIPFGKELNNFDTILLVTGIANPQPLENHLKRFCKVESMFFSDHHQFTLADLEKIHAKFDTFIAQSSIQRTLIVTTEKDFVRLDTTLSDEEKQKYPWYYQSITVKIDREEEFNALINNYVDTI